MTWFPVDDKAYADERFRRLGPGGCSLYAFAGSFCMDHLTDGFVPDWFVNEWPGGRKAAPKLVAEGIWTKVNGGHQFIEWPEFCTRKKVEAKRRKWRRNKIREGSGSTVESTPESPVETEGFHGGIHGSPSNPSNPSNPYQPPTGTGSKSSPKSGTSPGVGQRETFREYRQRNHEPVNPADCESAIRRATNPMWDQ